MTIDEYNGRISVIGQGGKFKTLEGIEKKVIESIAKKDARKEQRVRPKITKPKRVRKAKVFRAKREYDYRKDSHE